MKKQSEVEAFWQSYLVSLPEGVESSPILYEAWSFCDNEESANKLGDLVKDGTKTATCGLVWAYEAENEELPTVGDFSIITYWDGEPLCIIETTEVQVTAFNEVDEKFAYDEGEGDRSLAYWREAHWDFFQENVLPSGERLLKQCPFYVSVFV